MTTTTPAASTGSPVDLETVLAVVRAQVAWLDAANGRDQLEVSLRILKLAEETGEAAQAWIGRLGENPRKGVTHTRGQVAAELADVALSALVAIASLDLDPAEVLTGKARVVAARLPAGSGVVA